jgi:hypothetical protein
MNKLENEFLEYLIKCLFRIKKELATKLLGEVR